MTKEPSTIELTINGKTQTFKSGYAAWKWANQQSKNKLDDRFDDKHGPFLSDFFRKRWENRKRQSPE